MTAPPYESWHEEVCDRMIDEPIQYLKYVPISQDQGCFHIKLGTDCADIVALTMGGKPGEFFLTVRKARDPVGS